MRWVSMLLWMLVATAGCGQEFPVAPASGVVLLDGTPLAGASITTQPIATDSPNPGPGSFGRTDAEGRFELELVNPAMRGAIVGEHRVMIRPANAQPAAIAPRQAENGIKVFSDTPLKSTSADKWPASFTDGSLRIQVPSEGTKELRVELTRRTSGTKSGA
jgi:hypothetical protein